MNNITILMILAVLPVIIILLYVYNSDRQKEPTKLLLQLFLNFNEYLLDDNKKVENTNLNVIAYSVFDNYDVNMVMFEINNKKLTNIKR